MRLLLALILLAAAPTNSAPPLAEILTRAQRLLEQGDLSGARKELTQALTHYPGHPLVSNFMGVVEAEEGNYRSAEAHFRRAIQQAPGLADAYLNLGRLYQENAGGDEQAAGKALEVYGEMLAREPNHPEARYQSAVLLVARGEFSRSLDQIARLPPAAQERAAALALRCAAHAGLGHGGEADGAAEKLLSHPDLSEADVLSILPALGEHGRDDLALKLLQGLQQRGLASPDALRQLGIAHERQGKLDRAREILEAAGTRAGRISVELLLDLARVAEKAGDHKGALGYLAHARDLAPGNAQIHFLFGMVCVELGLGNEAYNALKEAVRLQPDNPHFNYALGAASMHRRDAGEAVSYFRRYAELKPEDPRGTLAVGVASFKAGDFEAARRELTRAVQQRGMTAAAQYYLARIAREENDLAQAVRLAQRAVEAEASYADAWAELGLLHLRRKEHQQAEKALERCLEIDPDNYVGNFHLLMLYQRTKDPRRTALEQRFEDLRKRREEKTEDFFRLIEVRPY